MGAQTNNYDMLVAGISIVGVMMFTLYILKEFHVKHVGIMLIVLCFEGLAFVIGEDYFTQITEMTVKGLALAASASIFFTGMKNTVFRKSQTPTTPPPEATPSLKDKSF